MPTICMLHAIANYVLENNLKAEGIYDDQLFLQFIVNFNIVVDFAVFHVFLKELENHIQFIW